MGDHHFSLSSEAVSAGWEGGGGGGGLLRSMQQFSLNIYLAGNSSPRISEYGQPRIHLNLFKFVYLS